MEVGGSGGAPPPRPPTTLLRLAAPMFLRSRLFTNPALPADFLAGSRRRLYFEEASWSTKRSYITVPGFHLPRVLDVAYAECRYTTGTP